MPDRRRSLRALAGLPGVPEAIAAAREACERLRWHEALRRRIPEAAAESRVRGAQASAALEGRTVPLDLVRDVMRGAAAWPLEPDPVERVARGVVQATAESEHVRGAGGDSARAGPGAAARGRRGRAGPAGQLGRPARAGETRPGARRPRPGPGRRGGARHGSAGSCGSVLRPRRQCPALVVAAVVHAEIATARPFVRGNGVVARAMERRWSRPPGSTRPASP